METKQTIRNADKFRNKNLGIALTGKIDEIRLVDSKHTKFGYKYIHMVWINLTDSNGQLVQIGLQYWSIYNKLYLQQGQQINFEIAEKMGFGRNAQLEYHLDFID